MTSAATQYREGPERFARNARRALADPVLQRALGNIPAGFQEKRAAAIARLPEFDELTRRAAAIKNETLADLDLYLELFETRVRERGGHVHFCRDAAEAREAVLSICRDAGARLVTKGKSMVAEEIALNDHLAENGITPVETDLGEYIIQLRREPPSHIIAPAIHLEAPQIADAFLESHRAYGRTRRLETPREMLDEARAILREKFLAADVGITGANLLVAETGAAVVVTNEGNADLTMSLPHVHVVLASIEKIVPTLEDACTILRVLARSATGQEITAYTTLAAGPREAGDADGPRSFHVVLLDNTRSAMLGGEFHDMLRCIRCAACMNHCPVYSAVGGHAYGWVYPGPMGAVMTPWLIGIDRAADLPNASTLCGRCQTVCPMRIPLPRLLRRWREKAFEKQPMARSVVAIKAWASVARRPWLYRRLARLGAGILGRLGRRRGALRFLPFAGGWTAGRDFPAPEGRTFYDLWERGER
jgi:L-lactate dehydrogenase complex protein LldF